MVQIYLLYKYTYEDRLPIVVVTHEFEAVILMTEIRRILDHIDYGLEIAKDIYIFPEDSYLDIGYCAIDIDGLDTHATYPQTGDYFHDI